MKKYRLLFVMSIYSHRINIFMAWSFKIFFFILGSYLVIGCNVYLNWKCCYSLISFSTQNNITFNVSVCAAIMYL